MQSSTMVKEVQRLTRCITSLGRFMSRSVDKCLPFFKVLKKKTPFGWDKEAEEVFQKFKEYLEKLPRMVSVSQGEPLLLYLAVSDHVISAVLLVERVRHQHPVYYLSHVLIEAKLRYLLVEKFAYGLLIASRNLRPYFESHHVTVLIDQPLRNTLEKYGSSRGTIKWAIELAPYGTSYEPRRATKAQPLADFIAECPTPPLGNSQQGEPSAA